MPEPIHEDEPDTSQATVRSLLKAELPHLADGHLEYVDTAGTDNAMWRLTLPGETELVVRLPRRSGAVTKLSAEAHICQAVRASKLNRLVATPRVVHLGRPSGRYPHHWSVFEWLGGEDAWAARHRLAEDSLAADLARVVRCIRSLSGVPAPKRVSGERGGPIEGVLERIDRWLGDPTWNADALVDAGTIRAIASEAESSDDAEPTFVHGDLIPGNLLVAEGTLTAIIDWGGAGYGDPAQDLSPAWSVLDVSGRKTFRDQLGADDSEWVRGRTIELEHALGAVLYYVPKGHVLGDIMGRTLERIVEDVRAQ